MRTKTTPDCKNVVAPDADAAAIPSNKQSADRKLTFIGFAIAGAIFLVVYLLRLDRVVGLFVDDAWYALLAKSLATGHGYQLINSPSPGILPVYPPAYPFLVSLAYRLWPSFPNNVLLLKLVSTVAMFVVGIACYKYFNRDRELPHWLSLISALTVTLMPSLVFLATSSTMSECVFMCFQLLAVLAIESAKRSEDTKKQLRLVAMGGALAAMAFLTRSIGLAVIGAGFLFLLKERMWRAAAVFTLAVMIVAGPWTFYSRTHQPTSEQRTEQGGMIVQDYSKQFWQASAGLSSSAVIHLDTLPDRIWDNLKQIFGNNIAKVFAPMLYRSSKLSGEETLESSKIAYSLSYLLSLILLIGFVATVRRRCGVAEITVVFTLLITSVWPWDTYRFLLPIVPFLFAYSLESMRWLRELMGHKLELKMASTPWRVVTIVMGLLLTSFLYDHSVYLAKRSDLSRAEYLPWRAIFDEHLESLNWIKENTPEDAVVCTQNPAMVYLYSGRKSVAGDNPVGNWENWKRLNVRYRAYLSVYAIAEPSLDEGRFQQAYRSKGPLKFRILDLGRPETRLPWASVGITGGSIRMDNLK